MATINGNLTPTLTADTPMLDERTPNKRKREDKGKGRADDFQRKGKAKRPKRETSEDFFKRYINDVDDA